MIDIENTVDKITELYGSVGWRGAVITAMRLIREDERERAARLVEMTFDGWMLDLETRDRVHRLIEDLKRED